MSLCSDIEKKLYQDELIKLWLLEISAKNIKLIMEKKIK